MTQVTNQQKKLLQELLSLYKTHRKREAQKLYTQHRKLFQELKEKLQEDNLSAQVTFLEEWILFNPKEYAEGYPEIELTEEDIQELETWLQN